MDNLTIFYTFITYRIFYCKMPLINVEYVSSTISLSLYIHVCMDIEDKFLISFVKWKTCKF